MKTIKILIIALLISSCSADSTDEDNCGCVNITYEYEQYVVFDPVTGLPSMAFDKVILSTEQVNCQDEQEQASAGNQVYFDIVCEN